MQRFRETVKAFGQSRFLRIIGVMFVAIVLAIAVLWVVLQGYSFSWTGLADYTTPKGEFVRGKTLWDWMELFIIPIFLAIGAFYLNRSERDSERQRAEERSTLEHEIAADRQQEAALQAYLDRMADLLLKENLRTSENEELRNVARIRTLTVLRGLDPKRTGMVLLFLNESGLISREPIIKLTGANLSEADLTRSVESRADLSRVNLSRANLWNADLSGANLNGADLSKANLSGAKISDEQLATVKSLRGTIMPDGTKHD